MIRKASIKDLPELIKLNGKNIQYHQKLSNNYELSDEEKTSIKIYFEKMLKESNIYCLIAEEGKTPVGFSVAMLKENFGIIAELFVLETERKKGIGKKLIEFSESWLKSNSANNCKIEVDSNNKSAIIFYKKLLYKEVTTGEKIVLQKKL